MADKIKTNKSIVKISELSHADIRQMYTLFESYYECVNFDNFVKDLKKKDGVVLIRTAGMEIIKGFSTYKLMSFTVNKNGKPTQAEGIFSGDTIVAKELWGQRVLNNAFSSLLIREKLKRPFSDFYWLLISKGYKTYLQLTNNFVGYYPRYDRSTPQHIQAVIDGYAGELYPEFYDQQSGVLRFPQSQGQLKAHVTPIDAKLIARLPNIEFFQKRNPNWQNGDELVCVGVVDWRLFARQIVKIFSRPRTQPKVSRPLPEQQVELS